MRYPEKHGLKYVADFLLWLLSANIFQHIIHLIAPIIIAALVDSSKLKTDFSVWNLFSYKDQKNFIIALIIYAILVIAFYLANLYQRHKEQSMWLSQEVKYKMVDTITSITEHVKQLYIGDENLEVFDALSQMVCNALHILLTKYYPDREVRVSIVKQYNDHGYKYYMPGYKSSNHSSGDMEPHPVKNCDKYIKGILESVDENYVVLNEKEIQEHFSFKKEKTQDKKMKQYIAIPYKGSFEKTCFVLQLDFNKKKSCGKNDQEIKCFINEYIRPFVQLLAYGYIIESIDA